MAAPPLQLAPLTIPLVNQFGRPYAPARPVDPYAIQGDPLVDIDEPGRVVVRTVQPSTVSTWTIGQIRAAISAHDQGDFTASGMLCDSVMTDDRVQATMESRSAALFGAEPIHTAVYGGTSLVEPWAQAYEACVTNDVAEEILQTGILMRVAIAEVVWDTVSVPWQPHLRPVHPSLTRYNSLSRRYEVLTDSGYVTVTPGDGRWFLYAPSGEGSGHRKAAIRAIGQPWFIRTRTWRDWARYNERHGLPVLKALVPAGGDAEAKRQFTAGLSTLGQESVIQLPQSMSGNSNYDVQMLEAKDRAWETFQRTIEACDMAIVLIVKWQNLTTQVEGGAYAAARVHAGVAQTGVVRDNKSFHAAVRRCVGRPWAKFNFGDADKAPRTLRDVEPEEDNKTEADVFGAFALGLSNLAKSGVEPTVDGVIKLALKYGIEMAPSDLKSASPAIAAVPVPSNPMVTP